MKVGVVMRDRRMGGSRSQDRWWCRSLSGRVVGNSRVKNRGCCRKGGISVLIWRGTDITVQLAWRLSSNSIDSAVSDSSSWSTHNGSGYIGRGIYRAGDNAVSSTGSGLGVSVGINSRLSEFCIAMDRPPIAGQLNYSFPTLVWELWVEDVVIRRVQTWLKRVQQRLKVKWLEHESWAGTISDIGSVS